MFALAEPKVACQLSSAVNTPQGPRVCRDCNVALPTAAYRQTCSTARSATWASKAARPFIGYQTILFQWSLHAIDGDGVLHHREFLADGGDDPRRRFAETLIEALAAFDAPILVYSAYEQTRLKDLAGEFPDLSAALDALIARLVDLLPIVRGAVYFPEFRFRNSIKSVAPALCPGFGYDDLEGVADGGISRIPTARIWLSHDSRGGRSSALRAPRILPA